MITVLSYTGVDIKHLVSWVNGIYKSQNHAQALKSTTELGQAAELLAKLKSSKQLDFSFAFLTIAFEADTELLLNLLNGYKDFHFWYCDTHVIMSGSVEQFKAACVQDHAKREKRLLFNAIFLMLERILPESVFEYIRVPQADGTFSLFKRL